MGGTATTGQTWVAIQRNPKSGSGTQRQMLVDLVRTLRALRLRPRVFKDRERLQRRVHDPRWRDGLRCIVAAGGDGTVADVFNRFPGIPVAVLPMGTENLLARHLGIPSSGADVARLIAADSRCRFDLGLVGNRRFALMVSAGFDAEVVRNTHAAREGHISHATYIQPILESLRNYEHPPLRITVDEVLVPQTARLAVIVNIPAYALGLPVARTARGDDGRLDLRLFEQGSAFQMIRYLCNLALGTHERLPDVISLTGSRLRIDSDVPVPLQADGDPIGFTPIEISVLPGALEVFAPRSGESRNPNDEGV
ncbi:MAG TPA: diacylglycerol kinase family protein [Planctomycetaceae bacterium]|nr:diacylglycerol kinase family protein [Planctomycetaceae bacterium]